MPHRSHPPRPPQNTTRIGRRLALGVRAAAGAAVCLVLLLVPSTPAHADRQYSWTLDKDSQHLSSPLPYLYDSEIDGMQEPTGTFKNPSDLFIDPSGDLWIADTGNNRILEFDAGGAFLREVGSAEGDGQLNAPEGVFIAADGAIWVADRGNGRIVQFAPDGGFVKALGKPSSKLLEADQVYQPNKLVIDRRGYIYVLNGGGDYRGIFLLDSEGEFRGFFGANRLNFDLGRLLIRVFTTDAQKQQISKVLPTHHANLFVDRRGFVYTVSPLADKDQIKKLNAIGVDVYQPGGEVFGELERRDLNLVKPQFVDVTVDDQGIVSALDFNSGRIYQYDQSANLLAIFGGRGPDRGTFELPQSLAVGPDGRIFVLDANRNNVQIFRPTEFADLLHTASRLYFEGRYDQAATTWQEVLRHDAFFELAHTGLGKAAFKRGDYLGAMKEYTVARNKDGYSQAFGEWRHDFLRANFAWVLPLIAFGAWVLTTVIQRTVRRLMALDLSNADTAPQP